MALDIAAVKREFDERLGRVLEVLATAKIRGSHFLADLAVISLAHQLHEHGTAASDLLRRSRAGAAFPSARAAFEAAEDLLLLMLSPSYDLDGARAYIAAQSAVAQAYGTSLGVAKRVRGEASAERPPSFRAVLAADAEVLRQLTDEADAMLEEANRLVQEARARGTRHWSGFSRDSIHDVLANRMADSSLSAVLRSWYERLAHMSHPGLRIGPGMMLGQATVTLTPTTAPNDPGPVAIPNGILGAVAEKLPAFVRGWDDEPPTRAGG
jgi:hypothetical protein